ncbi:agmatine deiminase family protein [Williamsia sterculiae]|uniref:Agmatine deiminase n=1 Tax=Williamsia sterculiae TaxID=1344003 RepID=A0A1N7HGE9_9NOCA|nr:agmatine deiminase family protein [Williamsia sterculiae]SIS23975.1 agmatine deiminase [Williamsia sterculiae]
MAYLMPAETAPQDRIWMAFPVARTYGEAETDFEAARATWAAVANAIVDVEPVTMLVDPSERDQATRLLSSAVDVEYVHLNDGWIRDIGPTFVHADDGSVAAVTWTFNGWGRPVEHPHSHDALVARTVAGLAGVPIVESSLVNEGGGIHVDGRGTVLATRTVQLDPMRNPRLTAADVEAEFARTLGATDVIWFGRGLTGDYGPAGTKGHVDICVTLPSPGRALVHTQHDPEHPDHILSQEFRRSLEYHRSDWDIVELPAPRTLTDAHGFNDWSYVNHLVVGGEGSDSAVIACSFGDPNDEAAQEILADVYPGRRVLAVDARPIFDRGGGIHCITQQQPTARR